VTGWIEDDVLRFEGLNNQDIADLNRILPDLQIIIAAVTPVLPAMQQLAAVVTAQDKRFHMVAPILARIVQKLIAKQQELGRERST
jgi:hypothetical protein